MVGSGRGQLHRTRAFEIPGLVGARPLTLYLPPDYAVATSKRYPVAFVFDGQNVFDDHGTLAGGWHMHHALDRLFAEGREVPIVVGIHHGVHREEELSPWPVEAVHTARGDALLDWVVGPLRKMVAAELRVLEGPEATMLGGASLGGLMALYGFFRHNEVFGKALCMSPALWVQQGQVFPYVAKARCVGEPRLYLDCGGKEANGMVIEHAKWMDELLTRKGFEPGHHHLWLPDEAGDHKEIDWRRRLPAALEFLYHGTTALP